MAEAEPCNHYAQSKVCTYIGECPHWDEFNTCNNEGLQPSKLETGEIGFISLLGNEYWGEVRAKEEAKTLATEIQESILQNSFTRAA